MTKALRVAGAALVPVLLLLSLFSPSAAAGNDLIRAQRVAAVTGGPEPGLRHPSDVVTTPGGQILVLDGVSNRVVRFNGRGEYLGTFGRGGSGEGELNHPLGLTVDGQGRIYIADSGNGRVQIYSAKGKYRSSIKLPQSEGQKRPDPTDVAVDDWRGLLYVVDNDNHRVLIYRLSSKKLITSLGQMSPEPGGFRWPFSISLARDGTAYVVDVINTVIRTIRPGETFGFGLDIGRWGLEKGELYRPKGVVLNSAGKVFVSDSYLGVIQVFDRNGKFLAVLSDGKGGIKRFKTPTRLHFDREGRLFVVEMFANRIGIYRLGQ